MTRDTALIVQLVGDAVHTRSSCAAVAQQRLGDNRAAMRKFRASTLLARHPEQLARMVDARQRENRRIRRLIATYASWRVA